MRRTSQHLYKASRLLLVGLIKIFKLLHIVFVQISYSLNIKNSCPTVLSRDVAGFIQRDTTWKWCHLVAKFRNL